MSRFFKKETRVLGIDDAPFSRKDDKVLVIGTIFRGGSWLDGVLTCTVTRDGDDATKAIAEMINNSKFKKQLQAILIDGIAVAGFNIIDIKQLFEQVKIPVIAVVRKFPDFEQIFNALEKLGKHEKIKVLKNIGMPVACNKVFIQFSGLSFEKACDLVKLTSTRSNIPEPLRVAHLIGSGIVLGESRGGA